MEQSGYRDDDVIGALALALKDEDVSVRVLAASALAGCGEAAGAALPRMVEALQREPDDGVRIAILEALFELGKGGVGAESTLRELTTSPNPVVALWAAATLVRVTGASQPYLTGLVESLRSSEDEGARQTAATLLGKLGPAAAPAVPALAAALRDSSSWVEYAAAESLGKVGTQADVAVPALCELASGRPDPAWEVDPRRAAVGALVDVWHEGRRGELISDTLFTLADQGDMAMRARAIWALDQTGAEGDRYDSVLAGALGGALVTEAALDALSRRDPLPGRTEEAVGTLMIQEDIRVKAATVLAELAAPSEGTLQALVLGAADTDARVAEVCVRALGKFAARGIATDRAIPRLSHLLVETHPNVAQAAAEALGEIGRPAVGALPKLRAIAQGRPREPLYADLMQAASEAIRKIETGQAASKP